MRIEKVVIENFKCFHGRFQIDLNDGLNVIVGQNESGKSTIIEAIHLCLTGLFNGRYLRNELSQYLFNKKTETDYLSAVKEGNSPEPPHILIELYLKGEDTPELANLIGNLNSDGESASGLRYMVHFNDDYKGEYEKLLESGTLRSIPIEFYRDSLKSFARRERTIRSLPLRSALVDATKVRTQSGSDVYVSRIIRDNLEDDDRVQISQAHRKMREGFMEEPAVKAISEKIGDDAKISDQNISISVDLSTQNAWETSLMTYLGDTPFHFIGRGEQSIIKTKLALSHKRAKEANVVLLEEPESHLSHSKLTQLLKSIQDDIGTKQIVVSTHNSFVANKLGLEGLILLSNQQTAKLDHLTPDSRDFFMKLAGYDTLRLVLCESAILVEGDSDELVVQRAYMDGHSGKLPLQNGIDVISVGTSFLRFLEIAEEIGTRVAVVTDSDGDVAAVKKKYQSYLGENAKDHIRICFDEEVDDGPLNEGENKFNYNTLEPKLLKVNDLNSLNGILGGAQASNDELLVSMRANKTEVALKIFEADTSITYPQYILDAIEHCGGE